MAAVLAIARAIRGQANPPRRSLILAVWDSEEDGHLGSKYYTEHPVVPLAKTVGYVNFDIQGANLLHSLRSTTFAVAAETGGARFQETVRGAAGFAGNVPLATFDDAVVFATLVNGAYADRGRFSADDQATIVRVRIAAHRRVSEGRAAFRSNDIQPLLGDAATMVRLWTHGSCDGFLVPSR